MRKEGQNQQGQEIWPEEMSPEEAWPEEILPEEVWPEEMPQELVHPAAVYYVEGEILSIIYDTMMVQPSECSKIKLRLSKSTLWDPFVNTTKINKHKYIAVDYVM